MTDASTTRPQGQIKPSWLPKPTPKPPMKVVIKRWNAVAQWRWDTRNGGKQEVDDDDGEDDVCGICRVPYEACCPACKIPGDDCPLSKF